MIVPMFREVVRVVGVTAMIEVSARCLDQVVHCEFVHLTYWITLQDHPLGGSDELGPVK